MKRSYRWSVMGLSLVVSAVLLGCSTPAPQVIEKTVLVEKTFEIELEVPVERPPENPEAPRLAATPAPTFEAGRALSAPQPRPNRMIIKNAELVLLVDDTDQALDLVTQIAGDVGGYMVSSRMWWV